MSPFVVHFTNGENASTNSMGILSSRQLRATNRFGIGRQYSASPPCVCLSEIPLRYVRRLSQRRSNYGIGFRKQLIVNNGGGPILYAYRGSQHAEALETLAQQNKSNPDHPIWKIVPFVDIPGQYGPREYFFEWEREWRVTNGLYFLPEDVAFLILPESIHDSARSFFDDVEVERLGPAYRCTFIDPSWCEDKIDDAVEEILSKPLSPSLSASPD